MRVHNESGRAIDSVIVTDPGVRAEIGPVAPGQHVLTNLHFAGDGSLMFSVKQQELHFGGELDGYVTGGLGGDKTIRIGANRVFAIRDSP